MLPAASHPPIRKLKRHELQTQSPTAPLAKTARPAQGFLPTLPTYPLRMLTSQFASVEQQQLQAQSDIMKQDFKVEEVGPDAPEQKQRLLPRGESEAPPAPAQPSSSVPPGSAQGSVLQHTAWGIEPVLSSEDLQRLQPGPYQTCHASSERVACKGLRVSDPLCSAMAGFEKEFDLYFAHVKKRPMCSRRAYPSGERYVQHFCCEMMTSHSSKTCFKCLSLGSTDSLLREVVRFSHVYFVATLLSSRIFQQPAQTAELIAEVKKTAMYHHSRKACEDNIEMTIWNLQTWVQDSFLSLPKYEMTSLHQEFMCGIVMPCLRVNAGSREEPRPGTLSNLTQLSGMVDQYCIEGSDTRHALPRRNNAGRQLVKKVFKIAKYDARNQIIRDLFTELNELDKEKNPNNAVFHEGIEGMCRLKHERAQGVTFAEFRERVAHFDNMSIRLRNTPAWGQHVFSTVKDIQEGLQAGNRKVWLKFLVLVLETTAEAL